MSTDATTTSTSWTQRLDRLPFTREHGRLVVGSGLGWALDAMDVGLISFVMAALAVQWSLTPTELSWIGSIGFVGMALGATLGGLLADRIGRRQFFALTLLVFGLATGAAALAWSVASLLVFRFLIGLGLGAELPVASTLVSEYAPARVRGRVVVALEAFWAVGWLLAALIGYLVVPRSDAGWRWALALAAVPALYAVVVRRALPESVPVPGTARSQRRGRGRRGRRVRPDRLDRRPAVRAAAAGRGRQRPGLRHLPAFFVLAGLAAVALPERRGESLGGRRRLTRSWWTGYSELDAGSGQAWLNRRATTCRA
jgi:MFS family permease